MPPLLGAMWQTDQNNVHVGDYISASMLTGSGCPRQVVNERYEAFWDEPRRRFWPFRGTLAHKMCEGSSTLLEKYGWLQEVTLAVPLEYDEPAPIFELRATDTGEMVKTFTGKYDPNQKLTIVVRGTFDAYNPFQKVLADLKSMAWRKVMDTIKGTKKGGLYSKHLEDSHVEQFNFYRWLISRTPITKEARENFKAHGLPELKGKNYPAPTQLVMQAIEMMELPRSGGTYALKERGATTLYDIDAVPVLPLHEIEAIIRPRALAWYKWLVLREPTPVVPKESNWLCVAPSTPVLTDTGYRCISEIQIGDKVLTRKGFKSVTGTSRRPLGTKQMFEVKPFYGEPLLVTSDHPLLVKLYGNIDEETRRVGAPVWRTPQELLDHRTTRVPDHRYSTKIRERTTPGRSPKLLLSFRTEERSLPVELTPAHLRVLGAFVAEGNLARRKLADSDVYYQVYFTLGRHEKAFIQELMEDLRTVFPALRVTSRDMFHRGTSSHRITVYGKDAADWFATFVQGRRATAKKLHDSIMYWPREAQGILLDAMHRGDGCVSNDTNTGTPVWSYATSSHALALQVQELAWRLSLPISLIRSVSKGAGFAKAGSISYRLACRPTTHAFGKFVGENLLEAPLQYIREVAYVGDVVDISVADEPEFVTSSGVIHNCKNCQFNGELLPHGTCFPEKERAETAE